MFLHPQMKTEHETFQLLTDSLELCVAAAKRLGEFRPDQSFQWDKMAETYNVAREAVFRLAGDGVARTRQ